MRISRIHPLAAAAVSVLLVAVVVGFVQRPGAVPALPVHTVTISSECAVAPNPVVVVRGTVVTFVTRDSALRCEVLVPHPAVTATSRLEASGTLRIKTTAPAGTYPYHVVCTDRGGFIPAQPGASATGAPLPPASTASGGEQRCSPPEMQVPPM